MTVTVLENNGLDTTRNRVIPSPQPPIVTNIGTNWVRPSEWPAATSISVSDQKAAMLAAVFDDNNNWFTFTATTSAGNFTVDWGDGVTENFASNATATHVYDYATLSGSVTSYGYKVATIIVTPQTANLLTLNLNFAAQTGQTNYRRWLEVLVGSPNLTNLTLRWSTTNVNNCTFPLLEHVKIVSMNSAYTNMDNLFYGNQNLKSIELPSLTNITTMSATFGALQGIDIFPSLSLPNVTTASNCFIDNITMKSIGSLNFRSNSNVNVFGLFANCRSLELVNDVTGQLSNVGNMFVNCHQLRSIGNVQLEYSNTTPTFNNCYSLESLPYMNTSNVSNINSRFQSMYALKDIPNWDYNNVTDMGNAFNLCTSLVNVNLNIAKVTNLNSTFQNCRSLSNVTLVTTGNLTNTGGTFIDCFSLENVNISNVTGVTNASQMYQSTSSLGNITDQNFSNCSNTRLMYSFSGVTGINNQNFPLASNVESMFANTSSALELGNLILGNANVFTRLIDNSRVANLKLTPNSTATSVNFATSFNSATNLRTFELVGPNITTIANGAFAFTSCGSLEKITFPGTLTLTTSGEQMFRNCASLRTIPALTVNANLQADTNVRSLATANLQGITANIVLSTGGLTKAPIETIFGNLNAGNSTLRNINVQTNPGVDTVVTKSSNTTSGSNVVVIANTVGLSTGMLVTGNNISNGRSVTFQDTGDTVTLTAHGISNNNIVSFSTITTTTGISVYTPYYVVNSATDTFQVSSTLNGAALPLTNNGSGTLLYGTFIDTINANANIIVSIPASGTATGQTLTFSVLNTSIATLKNWSVTR